MQQTDTEEKKKQQDNEEDKLQPKSDADEQQEDTSGQQSSMARMDSPIHERGARPRSGSGSGSICAGSPLL